MKKYFVFTGDDYYPRGGIGDYAGSYATLEEARAAIPGVRKEWVEVLTIDDDGSLWRLDRLDVP